jgi:hypothetical protein
MKFLRKFIFVLILFACEIDLHMNAIKQLLEREKVNTYNNYNESVWSLKT